MRTNLLFLLLVGSLLFSCGINNKKKQKKASIKDHPEKLIPVPRNVLKTLGAGPLKL
jgi:hypothetical protein